jgi:putative nucleotidyltransferase-like protein
MTTSTSAASVENAAADFYVDGLRRLRAAGVPFLVGGAFAYARYAKMHRDTKDFDIFLRRTDMQRAFDVFEAAGYRTELPFPHWLGKVYFDGHFMDLIFSSGNGIAAVDDLWFDYAVDHDVLGLRLQLCPPEEMIWSKAFVQERERFDGADVMHLIRELGPTLDWPRLLSRFADRWRVLLSFIVTFGFVYPDRRDQVPRWVVDELARRWSEDRAEPQNRVCYGTLLSREQYLADIEQLGYRDARVTPDGPMTEEQVRIWTASIDTKK